MTQCGPTREIKAWATTDDFQQEFICQPHLQVWPIFSPLEPLLPIMLPVETEVLLGDEGNLAYLHCFVNLIW